MKRTAATAPTAATAATAATTTTTTTSSANRFSPCGGQEEEGSAIWRVKLFMEKVASYRSLFWIGVAAAAIALFFNVRFYYQVASNAFGWGFFAALFAGIFVSLATSALQLAPETQTATARTTLRQLFVAGTKPKVIPVLDPKIVSDSENLIADYRDTEANNRAYFKVWRRTSFFIEGVAGVLFIGNIGAGFGAVIGLILFGLSIFGVEWGVKFALRAGEQELPQAIQTQLDNLLANDGKELPLRGL